MFLAGMFLHHDDWMRTFGCHPRPFPSFALVFSLITQFAARFHLTIMSEHPKRESRGRNAYFCTTATRKSQAASLRSKSMSAANRSLPAVREWESSFLHRRRRCRCSCNDHEMQATNGSPLNSAPSFSRVCTNCTLTEEYLVFITADQIWRNNR